MGGTFFLEKAKCFITILTKWVNYFFITYVRFFLQNLPKICILWVCLSASEMVGKRL
jgi:hypothetical protein